MENLRSWLLLIVVGLSLLILLSQLISGGRYRKKTGAEEKKQEKVGALQSYMKYRFALILGFYAVWIGVYLFLPEFMDDRFDLYWFNFTPVQIVGFIMSLGSLALIVYVQIKLGKNIRVGFDPDDKTELIVEGPYEHMRNPMFVGLLLLLFSIIMILPDTISISLLLIVFFLLEIQTRQEEDCLLTMHGEKYLEYMAKTPRYLPMKILKSAAGTHGTVKTEPEVSKKKIEESPLPAEENEGKATEEGDSKS